MIFIALVRNAYARLGASIPIRLIALGPSRRYVKGVDWQQTGLESKRVLLVAAIENYTQTANNIQTRSETANVGASCVRSKGLIPPKNEFLKNIVLDSKHESSTEKKIVLDHVLTINVDTFFLSVLLMTLTMTPSGLG